MNKQLLNIFQGFQSLLIMSRPLDDTGFIAFGKLGKGSEAALNDIARLYKKEILFAIKRIVQHDELAKEIFMDTLQTLWEQKKAVAKMEKPVGWLLTIARKKAINKIRDEKVRSTVNPGELPLLKSTDNIEAAMEERELQKYIAMAEEKLPPRQRKVYRLRIRNGLSYKEIAKECGVSEHTIRNQLSKAMKILRQEVSRLMHLILI